MMALKLGSTAACLRSAARLGSLERVVPSLPLQRGRSFHVATAAYQEGMAPTTDMPPMAMGYRTTAGYSIYKGKAAMSIKPIPATVKPVQTQNGNNYMVVDREGIILFEFASVNSAGPQAGYGERSYAWDRKINFGLKAHELGQLLNLEAEPNKPVDFLHDPDKGKATEGSSKKTLKVQTNQDGSLMFTMSLRPGNQQTGPYVSVPVSKGEWVAMQHLIKFSLPYLLGWHEVLQAPTYNGPPSGFN